MVSLGRLMLLISVLVSTEAIHFLCRRGFKNVFSFGNLIYLVEEHRPWEIYQYNPDNQCFDRPLPSFDSLISGRFSEIRYTVSLAGFCLKSPLCTDNSWNELEKLILIKGHHRNSGSLSSGFDLADRYIDGDRKLRLLPEETISENAREKMGKLNIRISEKMRFENRTLKPKFTQISKETTTTDVQSPFKPEIDIHGIVFVPSRAEMLVLTNKYIYGESYYNSKGQRTTHVFRRKFNNLTEQWTETKLDIEETVRVVGLISIGENVHAVGWDTELFDVIWDKDDKISINRTMRKLTNCAETITPTPDVNSLLLD